jgi:hypothetical protein
LQDAPVVQPDKLVERVRVAFLRAPNQFCFSLLHLPSSSSK